MFAKLRLMVRIMLIMNLTIAAFSRRNHGLIRRKNFEPELIGTSTWL